MQHISQLKIQVLRFRKQITTLAVIAVAVVAANVGACRLQKAAPNGDAATPIPARSEAPR